MPKPEFEQITDAQKATADALVTIMRTSFEGMQRLTELNMAAAREAFASNVASIGKLASSNGMTGMAPFSGDMANPERMMEYWRNVYGLVSAMQRDVSAAMQANCTQLARSAASAIEQKHGSGANGGDAIADVMRSMLEQGNKMFDSMASITSQMTEAANAQMQAAMSTPAKPAGSAGKAGSKR